MKRRSVIASCALLSCLLSACGGGGGGGGTTTTPTVPAAPTATAAQGLWTGTTSSRRALAALVFDDGSYHLFYSGADSPTTVAGVIQGSGDGVDGAFASTDGRDFNLEGNGIRATGVSGSVSAGQSFSGSLAGAETVTFNAGYDSASGTPASLDGLAGHFDGRLASASGETLHVALDIASDGVLSGDGNGCVLGGRAQPHVGANAWDVTVAFSIETCPLADQGFSGVAYVDAEGKLRLAATNGERSDAVLFLGTRR